MEASTFGKTLTALVRGEDWLRESARHALDERDGIHTSILAYAEVLALFYDREQSESDIDVPRAIANRLATSGEGVLSSEQESDTIGLDSTRTRR